MLTFAGLFLCHLHDISKCEGLVFDLSVNASDSLRQLFRFSRIFVHTNVAALRVFPHVQLMHIYYDILPVSS